MRLLNNPRRRVRALTVDNEGCKDAIAHVTAAVANTECRGLIVALVERQRKR